MESSLEAAVGTIGIRLKAWVEAVFPTHFKAAAYYEVQPTLLYRYMRNETTPGGVFLAKLALHGCNVNWLLHGIGDMYSNDQYGVAARSIAEKPVSPLGGESTGYAATLDPKKRKG